MTGGGSEQGGMMEEKVLTRPTPIVAGNAFAALRLSRANRSSLGNRARRTGTVLVCLMFAFVACADEVTPRAVGLEATQDFPLALYKLHKKPETRRKLPDKLQEISGLAVTPEGRLLAHDDERGVVYELNVRKGKISKRFFLGRDVVTADFEGIAVAEGAVFLVTSGGTLYETREGADEEHVDYQTRDTGIGDVCEVEGLDFEPLDRVLLLACKTTRGSELKDSVTIFRWSLVDKRLAEPPYIRVANDRIREYLPTKKFHPSGIARHPASGNYFILSGREHVVVEITPSGVPVGATQLNNGRHQQAEGIAIDVGDVGDFDIVISDEGDDGRARLARYRARRKSR
jgi:uncharacterized protein YjiK